MVIRFLVRASKRRAGGFSHYVIILLSEHDHKNSCCRTVIYTFSKQRNHKYCVRLALIEAYHLDSRGCLEYKRAGQLFAHAQ